MMGSGYLVETRLGWVAVEWGDRGITRLFLPPGDKETARCFLWSVSNYQPAQVRDFARRLASYFEGEPVDFPDPVDTVGATAFQNEVWQALREIPLGTTLTYGQLAQRLGKPRAARAVGQAVGANRVPIVIPCHRVVAANGGLGGYTGAALSFKAELLRLEAGAASHAR